MTKIRRLKKDIKSLATDLMSECETYLKFHPETDSKKLNKISEELERKLDLLIYEINHFENADGVKPKDYYKKVVDKVNNELIPVLDKIEEISKK